MSQEEPPTPTRSVAGGSRRGWKSARNWILAFAVLSGGLAASGVLDGPAQASADRVFRQALLTYAAARTLDAAVSLAEGTELALQPAGVGVTVSAGEVLEPIDDLVEQFSAVMLVSATSLGVQSLLLRASAWGVVTLLLVIFLAARVALAYAPERFHPRARRVVEVGVPLLLVCRFAMPVYALGTSLVFERYLQPSQSAAVAAIEETGADIREIEQLAEPEPNAGLVGRVSAWFSDAVERLDVSERITAFQERVTAAVEHLMHLLVIFFFQTIVLPVGFIWLLPKVVGIMTSPRPR
jgi:hypothetical protein